MTISDLVTALDAELVAGNDSHGGVVEDFAASDLLSDILTFEKDGYALITGLTNSQIIRTAEITGARCVVIVRGKKPQQAAVGLAERSGIPLLLSPLSMFEACSRLGHLRDANHAGPEGTSDTIGA
ncbi:MAG: DRTGG domain-containing protein [Verrucomicrobiota bacterium]